MGEDMSHTPEESPEIFRGHFVECVAHMAQAFNKISPPGKKDRYRPISRLVSFVKVNVTTVKRWFDSDGDVILGENYLRMIFFLDLNGYKVIELERTPSILRKLAELVAYNIVTMKEVCQFVGFTQEASFFAIFRGDRGVSKEKEELMWNLWRSKRQEIFERKKDCSQKYRLGFLTKKTQKPLIQQTTPKEPKTEQVQQVVVVPSVDNNTVPRRAVMDVMRGLKSLLELGVFQNLTQDEIGQLKDGDVEVINSLNIYFNGLSYQITTTRGGGKT